MSGAPSSCFLLMVGSWYLSQKAGKACKGKNALAYLTSFWSRAGAYMSGAPFSCLLSKVGSRYFSQKAGKACSRKNALAYLTSCLDFLTSFLV